MNTTDLTFNGRLPGVLCETTVPNKIENALRMDVTGFVGFAERGPIDIPVMIEDLSQFRLIFGNDLPVAIDKGLPVYAHLPAAVEAFFENGGQRCYVVRVAGSGHRANRFILPGLFQPDNDGAWQPVTVQAASSGRWSDFVSVSTSLRNQPLRIRNEVEPLALSGTEIRNGTFALPLRIPAIKSVTQGDLLRLQMQHSAEETLIVYMQIRQIELESTDTPSLSGTPIRVSPVPESVRMFDNRPGSRIHRHVDQLTAQGWAHLPFAQSEISWVVPDVLGGTETYKLRLPIREEPTLLEPIINVGDLLRLRAGPQQPDLFLPVERVQREPSESDPANSQLVIESVEPLLERRNLNSSLWTLQRADLLTFDLTINEGDETMEQWTNLSFGHDEGSWQSVLAQEFDHSQVEPPAFGVEHFTRRSLRIGQFEAGSSNQSVLYPLGITPVRQRFGPQSDFQAEGKDGLDHYDPQTLFSDQAFLNVTSRNVNSVANDLLYTGPNPRRLTGIHSLLPIREIALIALPDLAHSGWEPLPAPSFSLPDEPEPVDEPPEGFHDCAEDPASQEDECVAVPVINLDQSAAGSAPNIQTIFEDLPDALSPAAYDEKPLLAVQRILIRLCAAQADRMAILSLPRHYRGRRVEEWQQRLVATPEFFDGAPLSYAATYHGWVGMRETTIPSLAPLRYTPPDGAVCGLIAAREIERGAWIAPANDPLRTVADLDPNASDDEWLSFYNLQLNILRRRPGRYVLLSALTLSRNRLLAQISVRRLLIFLRKLALQEGQRYVFETNNERFRAAVQTYFERIMDQLLAQGGVQAYQIVTNEEVNTQNDIDNGRFVIALKVAPTNPIEFITVILLRSGDDGIDILEL